MASPTDDTADLLATDHTGAHGQCEMRRRYQACRCPLAELVITSTVVHVFNSRISYNEGTVFTTRCRCCGGVIPD